MIGGSKGNLLFSHVGLSTECLAVFGAKYHVNVLRIVVWWWFDPCSVCGLRHVARPDMTLETPNSDQSRHVHDEFVVLFVSICHLTPQINAGCLRRFQSLIANSSS